MRHKSRINRDCEHTHYFAYEYDFDQMIRTAKDILLNKLCAVVAYAGEKWVSSELSEVPVTIDDYHENDGMTARAFREENIHVDTIQNIFWMPNDQSPEA